MAALVTALTEFADNGNSRTYTTSGHTVIQPKLVIQKRKVPSTATGSAEISVAVIHGTTDSSSEPLASRVVGEVRVRYPLNGTTTDRDAMLVILRDVVQSTEFGTSVGNQNWLAA